MSRIYNFNELTDSVELLEKKPPRFITFFLGLLIVFFLFFSIWSYFGKIDVVSTGPALIQNEIEPTVIKSQIEGVVEQVEVKQGESVKKGDVVVQIKNQQLIDKKEEIVLTVNHLKTKKKMLIKLKKSFANNKSLNKADVSEKVFEEYKLYLEKYATLEKEIEIEIGDIERSKVLDEFDEVLQELKEQKKNIEIEINSLNKQKQEKNINKEQKQAIDEQIFTIKEKKNIIINRIEQRKLYLVQENSKLNEIKNEKESSGNQRINEYKQNSIVSVNERIEVIEDEILTKKNELISITNESNKMTLRSTLNGEIQFISKLQKGNLVVAGQEVYYTIPKNVMKKVIILLPAQNMKNINLGDKVEYSFQLESGDKQKGRISYIPSQPIYNKDSKSYVFEIEGTINVKNNDELITGTLGKASIITGEDSVWKFILKKLDFFS